MTEQNEKNTNDIVSEIANSERARVLHNIVESLPKHAESSSLQGGNG